MEEGFCDVMCSDDSGFCGVMCSEQWLRVGVFLLGGVCFCFGRLLRMRLPECPTNLETLDKLSSHKLPNDKPVSQALAAGHFAFQARGRTWARTPL